MYRSIMCCTWVAATRAAAVVFLVGHAGFAVPVAGCVLLPSCVFTLGLCAGSFVRTQAPIDCKLGAASGC